MKDSLTDVHRLLMVQLEALCDESLSGEALEAAIRRADSSVRVSGAITANARVVLDAHRHIAELSGSRAARPPRFITGPESDR